MTICGFLNYRIYPNTDDPAKEHLLNAMLQVLRNETFLGHVTAGFRKLKILTIKKVNVIW